MPLPTSTSRKLPRPQRVCIGKAHIACDILDMFSPHCQHERRNRASSDTGTTNATVQKGTLRYMSDSTGLPPNYHYHRLSNGIELIGQYMPSLASITFGFQLEAGVVHEPQEKLGLAHLFEY